MVDLVTYSVRVRARVHIRTANRRTITRITLHKRFRCERNDFEELFHLVEKWIDDRYREWYVYNVYRCGPNCHRVYRSKGGF